jgi:hypothetical protein
MVPRSGGGVCGVSPRGGGADVRERCEGGVAPEAGLFTG